MELESKLYEKQGNVITGCGQRWLLAFENVHFRDAWRCRPGFVRTRKELNAGDQQGRWRKLE